MEGAKDKIGTLFEVGKAFTYRNFASLEPEGRWATAFQPAYLAWRTRVSGAFEAIFAKDAAPIRLLAEAQRVELIGNGSEKFELCQSYYLGALQAAAEILEEDTFGEIRGDGAHAPLNFSNKVFIVHGHDERAKGEVTLPSDLDGIIYKKFDERIEEVAYAITKELKAAGYQLK